jgi:hypothetical protein
MDKIFHSTFDFFTHSLPGICVVGALFVLDPSHHTVDDFIEHANRIELGGGILLLVVSYIIGFAIHPIGRLLYKRIGFRIWNEKIENNLDLFLSDKYALIRELAPTNFKYVETWNMFCAMGHNLAVASLILVICCIIKLFVHQTPEIGFWLTVLIASAIAFFIFLQRAVRFAIWAAHDINSTIRSLNLVEKAK